MSFSIRPARLADAEAIAAIWITARKTNAIDQVCFPDGFTDEGIQLHVKAFTGELNDPENTMYLVESNETSGPVAFIGWKTGTVESLNTHKTEGGLYELFPAIYNMGDRPYILQLAAESKQGWEDFMGDRQHIILNTLYTLPSFERKGIATSMLNLVKSHADELNIPIVLTATPLGKSLYEKHGFRTFKEYTVHFVRRGQEAPEPYQNWHMVREPVN